MPEEKIRQKRKYSRACKNVIAYERGRTVWYSSFNSVVGHYGTRTPTQVKKLLEGGVTAPDGYTTFDYAIEGYPYEGMKDRDFEKLVDDKWKEYE